MKCDQTSTSSNFFNLVQLHITFKPLKKYNSFKHGAEIVETLVLILFSLGLVFFFCVDAHRLVRICIMFFLGTWFTFV